MKKGFTLIEMLLVVSIMLILTLIIVPIYQESRNQLALQRAANKLAQDIRRAEQMAMSTKECDICGGIIPSGGYGIYLATTTWPNPEGYTAYFYADTSSVAQERYDSGDQIIETISLEKEVRIKTVEDTLFVPNRKKFSVNFKSPDPVINLMRWDPGAEQQLIGDLLITLSLKEDATKTKSIRVNKVGLIYIE